MTPPKLLSSSVAFLSSSNPSGVVMCLFSDSCPSCADDALGSSSFGVTSEIPPVRLRIRGLCGQPRLLATAASFPCKLSLWSSLPAGLPGVAEVLLNHGREETSLRLLCCLSLNAG